MNRHKSYILLGTTVPAAIVENGALSQFLFYPPEEFSGVRKANQTASWVAISGCQVIPGFLKPLLLLTTQKRSCPEVAHI